MLALFISACGIGGFKPRNDLEAKLDGNVDDVIASLESHIADNAGDPRKLESDLLQAGFGKGAFLKDASEDETVRTNCQFYNYSRKGDFFGFGASAVVWVCEKGSGANFGYKAP